MTISVTITAENASEFRNVLTGLLGTTDLSQPLTAASFGGTPATAENTAMTSDPAPEPAKRGRGKKAEATAAAEPAPAAQEEPQIRANPEDRKPPEEPAETVAQDRADEAAEQAANAPAELTLDSIRGALKEYQTAYGTAAVMEDGPRVLKLIFGDAVEKVSQVPETQEAIGKAVAGIKEMLAKNPFKRTPDL